MPEGLQAIIPGHLRLNVKYVAVAIHAVYGVPSSGICPNPDTNSSNSSACRGVQRRERYEIINTYWMGEGARRAVHGAFSRGVSPLPLSFFSPTDQVLTTGNKQKT